VLDLALESVDRTRRVVPVWHPERLSWSTESNMSRVLSHMTMSLDGYIAQPHDQIGELFDWYGTGDTLVATHNDDISFRVDPASAEELRDLIGRAGALIAGRHLFDLTDGWGDNHPASERVVVVTHRPPADAER
jgi:dihydrofolate reductase